MAVDRVASGAVTSGIVRIRGQMSRWRYPHPDLTPEHCTILQNVNLTERGVASSRYGYGKYCSAVLAGPERPVGLWQGMFASGETRQVVVTPTKIYSATASAYTDVTGSALTGGVDNRVRFAFLKDQLIICNGVDNLQVWDGVPANAATELAGVPWTAVKDVMVHQNLLIAMGTTEAATYNPTRIRWCDINRQTFTVSITDWPSANRYETYDGGPAIIGGVDCWGKAMIFKRDGLYPGAISYDELGHLSFKLESPRRGFTPVSRDSIIARPEFLLVAAKEGLVVFDENLQMQVVNSGDYTTWAGLNQGRMQYCQAFVREEDRQVRLLCSSASNSSGHDRVLVWDWDSGDTWLDTSGDALSYGQSFKDSNTEYDWLGTVEGYTELGNSATYSTDDGTQIPWRIRMSPNDLGMPGKLKHVLNIRTLYRYRTGSGTITMRVHLDDGIFTPVNGTLTTSAPYQWEDGTTWNSGVEWPTSGVYYKDLWVNRICHTVAPEWLSSYPANLEGYIVEYIPLEG